MWLEPSEIFYCQDSIHNKFRNGSPIGGLLDDLCEGRCSVTFIPKIEVFQEDGKWYSLDNRRLWVFHHLQGADPEKLKCGKIEVCMGSKSCRKFTTRNGGESIIIRNGSPGGCWYPGTTPVKPKSKPVKVEEEKKPVSVCEPTSGSEAVLGSKLEFEAKSVSVIESKPAVVCKAEPECKTVTKRHTAQNATGEKRKHDSESGLSSITSNKSAKYTDDGINDSGVGNQGVIETVSKCGKIENKLLCPDIENSTDNDTQESFMDEFDDAETITHHCFGMNCKMCGIGDSEAEQSSDTEEDYDTCCYDDTEEEEIICAYNPEYATNVNPELFDEGVDSDGAIVNSFASDSDSSDAFSFDDSEYEASEDDVEATSDIIESKQDTTHSNHLQNLFSYTPHKSSALISKLISPTETMIRKVNVGATTTVNQSAKNKSMVRNTPKLFASFDRCKYPVTM